MSKPFGMIYTGGMSDELMYYSHEALWGFENALKKNFWQGVASMISGHRNHLLAFDEIAERLPFEGQHDAGVQEIPVDQIMGSVGRSQDFNAEFMPRSNKIRPRWIKIARANLLGEYIPPIEVIQVGSVYFVKDGNHRVSVARSLGQVTITAHVVMVRVPEALSGRTDLEDAIGDYEREQFEQFTGIRVACPESKIEPTVPGFYGKLLNHVATHRWLMGEERQGEVSPEEATADWYQQVYLPVVQAVRRHHLLAAFPGRTEADLYIWISEHAWYLSREGQAVNYEDAAVTLVDAKAGEQPWLSHMFWKMWKKLAD